MWGLGLIELVLIALFAVAAIISISFDRKGSEEAKWWTLVFGAVIAFGVTWSDWTFAGLWDGLKSAAFWSNVGIYVLIGLCYSIVEFTLAVRRAARYYAAAWKIHTGTWSAERSDSDRLRSFFASYRKPSDARFVDLERGNNNLPEPKLNKEELAAHIGAWTFWWPAYAVSLILGDLLTEVFQIISNFLVTISGRFVRMAFKDAFK